MAERDAESGGSLTVSEARSKTQRVEADGNNMAAASQVAERVAGASSVWLVDDLPAAY